MGINLVTPGIDYTDQATYRDWPVKSLFVQVDNGPVYYQLYLAPAFMPGGGQWLQASGHYLKPGVWTFDGDDFRNLACGGIRFKLAVATQPAVVSVA